MTMNLAHLKQVSETLNMFNLKEEQLLRGFDPNRVSSRNLASIRYNNIFTDLMKKIFKTHQKGGGNNATITC